MAVPSDGSYGIQEGVIFSFPVTCKVMRERILMERESPAARVLMFTRHPAMGVGGNRTASTRSSRAFR